MRKVFGTALVFAAVMAGVAVAADDAAAFVGVKGCGMCHKKPETGDQLGKWQASPHAGAFAALGKPEAKAVAAKLGIDDPQKSGKCLKCHSTAYNLTETLQVKPLEEGATAKIVPEDGVTCESCHGAGKGYKAITVMKDRTQAVAGCMVYPATQSCAKCHNEQSPVWKTDRYTTKDGKKVGFDAEQAAVKIAHPDPLVKK